MKQRISMGTTGQAIVVTNLKFNADGFVEDQRAALVPFDSTRDQGEMLEKAGRFEWEIYGLRNIQGFYSARQKRELTPDELSKQVTTGSGRTLLNEVVEAEAVTQQVANSLNQGTNTGARVNADPVLTQG